MSTYSKVIEEVQNRFELGLITESQAERYIELANEKYVSEGANIDIKTELDNTKKSSNIAIKAFKKSLKAKDFNGARKYLKEADKCIDKGISSIKKIDVNDEDAVFGAAIQFTNTIGKLITTVVAMTIVAVGKVVLDAHRDMKRLGVTYSKDTEPILHELIHKSATEVAKILDASAVGATGFIVGAEVLTAIRNSKDQKTVNVFKAKCLKSLMETKKEISKFIADVDTLEKKYKLSEKAKKDKEKAKAAKKNKKVVKESSEDLYEDTLEVITEAYLNDSIDENEYNLLVENAEDTDFVIDYMESVL